MNNYFLNQNIQNAFYTLHEYWIKNYPNATLTIGKQTTITDNSRTHTVIRPKKTTTRKERIGNKMDKYLLESITAAILVPSTTIGKTIKEILSIDKNLSYERQLELYGHLGEIIEDMKLMKKTTSEIQVEILGIIQLDVPRVLTIARKAKTLIQRFGLLDTKLISPQVLYTLFTKDFNKLVSFEAKSKKVVNSTFPIVTNKVLTREGLSVIEAARQNILAIFFLKNSSKKLPLVASGSFSLPSKRHTRVSLSVVSTTSKSPIIFNNKPVNKLVFSALTTFTTTSTTTASQMATKAKNSKKQQQAVATAMVTLNPFVVLNKILGKISTAAASSLPNMDGNSNSLSPNMKQNQPLAVLSDVVISGRSSPVMKAKQPINPDDLKDWANQIELELSTPPPVSGVADVALHDVPLGTFSDNIKTALGIFGVVTSVKLKPAGLWQYAVVNFKDTSSAATALSHWSVLVRKDSVRIFPIANQKEVISSRDAFKAKLVNFPFCCTAFEISDLVFQVGGCTCFISHSPNFYQHQCFAVVTFDSLKSLNAAVSKTGILHGCRIWWKTLECCCCYRCQSLEHLAVDCKVLPSLFSKLSSNSADGSNIFKLFFVGAKSYAKAATSVFLPVCPLKDAVPLVPVASSGSDVAVNTRLASLKTQLSELSLLIKSIVEPVGFLVALVTKLLLTSPVMAETIKESVIGLGNQINAVCAVASVLQKEVGAIKLKSGKVYFDISDDEDMDDDDDDNDDNNVKDFSVDTFNAMMELWEVQSSNIKSDPDQTAKWMSGLVKSSHELVCIMGKMYELDMFNTLGSKVSRDAVKLFSVEFVSQESLNGAIKVVIGKEVFLTTLKIAWSSGVASVSSSSLSVAFHNVPLDTSPDNIKAALGIFGVVTSVKLKPAGLWQYAVVHFKDISSAAEALKYWSVLVKKDSVRILFVVNQREIIASRDAFKAKLVNLLFGCTAFEISDLETPGCYHCYRCQDLDYLALECKVLSLLPPKVSSNFFSGPKVFKSSFAGSKSYAKAAAIVVPSVAAAANINLNLGSPLPTTTLMLPVAHSVVDNAVNARLASLESHLGKMFLLIKSLVEPVGALVVLVTKLLFTSSVVDVSVKKSVAGLAKQNKGLAAVAIVMQKKMTCLEKKCEWTCLENVLDNDNMDNDNDDNIKDKDFFVYDRKCFAVGFECMLNNIVSFSGSVMTLIG
ncbi:hypothetical protein G9A89_017390 [Geosiphon pyriformis]|nr:hypothetical protein G9A89_017390 [Geosiphon pyriformis]